MKPEYDRGNRQHCTNLRDLPEAVSFRELLGAGALSPLAIEPVRHDQSRP
jgi:hypothetical protein